MKKINLILAITFLFHSCGGFKEAGKVLRNEKVKTTDEFLVKKKDPLILPPDFDKIPTPGSISNVENKRSDFKEIIKKNKSKEINSKNSSSIEDKILKKIPK